MPVAQRFSGDGEGLHEDLSVSAAFTSADGQHEGGLGPASGGRVRPVHDGRSLALSEHRLPEPSALGPELPGVGRCVAAWPAPLEADLQTLPQASYLQESETPGAQVASAYVPDQGAAR